MTDVLEKIYTVLDTIYQFFDWVYTSANMVGSWISENFHYITDLISAVPTNWGFAISVMAAAALVYLVLGR